MEERVDQARANAPPKCTRGASKACEMAECVWKGPGTNTRCGGETNRRRIAPGGSNRATNQLHRRRGRSSSNVVKCVSENGISSMSPQPKVPSRKVALFVEPSPFTYICGYKNRFCNAIRFLREAGDEIMAVVPEDGDTPEPEEYFGAKVVPTKAFRLPWYPVLPLSLPLSPRVYYALKEFKPDVIHASSPGVMVFAAILFAKMLAVPLVLSYHTHLPKYIPDYTFSWLVKPAWALLRFVHKAADLTLTTSKAMADELIQAGVAAVHALEVWLRGVDSEIFHPKHKCKDMRRRLTGDMPNAPCVVHVGRLGAEKNLKYLKRIMQEVRKKHPDTQLAFVGDGPYRQELERHFANCKWVHFMGMLKGQELSAAYASGDVFVMPSESETLGFVVLEAMAAGVPVVAVKAGGIPDIVTRNGEVGFLYESGDTKAAASYIESLLESEELRERVGTKAREEVQKWDWRAATTHLREQQYTSAIANFRARRAKQGNSEEELVPSYAL